MKEGGGNDVSFDIQIISHQIIAHFKPWGEGEDSNCKWA
jgi:hypothetical protein